MTDFHFYLGHGCIIIGLFFIFTAMIGVKRFPDIFSKIHATGVADSLGFPLSYIGLALISLEKGGEVKYLFLVVLTLLTSTIITHSLAKSIYKKPSEKRK